MRIESLSPALGRVKPGQAGSSCCVHCCQCKLKPWTNGFVDVLDSTTGLLTGRPCPMAPTTPRPRAPVSTGTGLLRQACTLSRTCTAETLFGTLAETLAGTHHPSVGRAFRSGDLGKIATTAETLTEDLRPTRHSDEVTAVQQ